MGTTASGPNGARWRKSSRTNGGNDAQCVELRWQQAVRDSKSPRTELPTSGAAWTAFISAAANGTLDYRS